ncbi:MAG: hypothetical protein ACOYN3_00950 [Acidimicrobiia bacterium]
MFRRVEAGSGTPDVVHILDTQVVVLEQMRGLLVDLERIEGV